MPRTFQEFDRSGRELDFVRRTPRCLNFLWSIDSCNFNKRILQSDTIAERLGQVDSMKIEEYDRERGVIQKYNNVI